VLKRAFIDTNLFLHFRPLHEIPWTHLLAATSVELFLAPVVYRQLDRHKDQHPIGKLRKRARQAVSRIQGDLGEEASGEIAPYVRLVFLHEDPRIDFSAARLSERSEDDALIATMLQYSCDKTTPAAELILVTDDPLLRRKARSHGFVAIPPPADARLPDEPTNEEKQVRALEDSLRRATGRTPKLEVRFDNDLDHLKVTLRPLGPLSQEERSRKVAGIRQDHPRFELSKVVPPSPGRDPGREQAADGFDRLRVFADSIERSAQEDYNTELDDFYREYEAYIDRAHGYRQMISRSVTFQLRVANTGTAPATDIDVRVSCDEEGLVLEKAKDLRAPSPPTPPHQPSAATMARLIDASSLAVPPSSPDLLLNLSPDSSISMRPLAPGFQMTISLRKLKHTLKRTFGPFRIVFVSDDRIRPFAMRYTVNSADIPDNTEGLLHIVPTIVSNEPPPPTFP
jgi:hypothetical protein